MPLYNAASKARNATSIVNQNQGGGSKKAGFPYMVGRGYLTSLVFHATGSNCCNLSNQMTMPLKNVNQSRPISSINVPGVKWV